MKNICFLFVCYFKVYYSLGAIDRIPGRSYEE